MPSATPQPSPTHSLIPFLESQTQATLNRLYAGPSSCLCVFRLLGPLERQVVMNLLWLESAVPMSTMSSWVTKEGRKQYEAALSTLFKLHLFSKSPLKLTLSPAFKAGLRMAITGGGTTGSFGFPALESDKDKEKHKDRPSVTVKMLDGYALERWETILHYMVSSSPASKPSQGVLFLLQRSGLMGRSGGQMQITSAGFQFLLHSPGTQLWQLLAIYLGMAQERKMDLVEVLSFLFMLSTMELGREYSAENLSATQKAMLEDLRDYGLIWQRKPSSRRFSPTRLATTLTSFSPALPTGTGLGSQGQQGFIILETNYRIYAYTDNPLQIAVLNLFVSLLYRFPNLIIGSITRDSVKGALANGISADQVISYLSTHAHPQMKKNNPLIPVTIQDQIRLWELERNRVRGEEGYLYVSFASQGDYELVLAYARQLGVVLWESAIKRCFFGKTDGHARVREFIERRTGAGR